MAPTMPSTAVLTRLTGSFRPRRESLPEPTATMPSGCHLPQTALAPKAIHAVAAYDHQVGRIGAVLASGRQRIIKLVPVRSITSIHAAVRLRPAS